jgi:hypothetical protein
MHFFGVVGSLMFFLGLISVGIVGVNKLIHIMNGTSAPLITNSPYFFLAITSMIIGTQLFLAGFLGEMISRNSQDRNEYKLDETINI